MKFGMTTYLDPLNCINSEKLDPRDAAFCRNSFIYYFIDCKQLMTL